MRSKFVLWMTLAAALSACSSPYPYTDQVQTFSKGATALESADKEIATATVAAQHLLNRLEWSAARVALKLTPGCDINAAESEICEPIPVDVVVVPAPNRTKPPPAPPVPDVCATTPASPGTNAPARKLPASVDRAAMLKAIDHYAVGLAALTNAKDRADFDNASAKLAGALGDLAKSAGPEGAASAPVVKASASLLLWIIGEELDYRRFEQLQIATAAACEPIHVVADALGVGSEQINARDLAILRLTLAFRLRRVNQSRASRAVSDQEIATAIDDLYEAADAFQTLRRIDPWATAQAMRKAHDDLVVAVRSGTVDLAVVEVLNAGTLDDPSSVMPTLEIYCDRALPWVQLAGGMQRFAQNRTSPE
jgi:hypothetical protein